MDTIPEYVVARLNRVLAERRAAGVDVISLGIGDPDLPPDPRIRARLAEEVQRDDAARYPTNSGQAELREAVAEHYARRFGVTLDPATEILPLLGAKEGLAHLALAVLDPGSLSLVADPGYPVYTGGPLLAGAGSHPLPLLAANGFQPDLAGVPAEAAARARLLLCGYPNNPTGAVAAPDLFARLAAFGDEHDLVLCHDHAYAELAFDDAAAPSALSDAGFRARGIEILSLSKTFSIPGWRVAFAVCNVSRPRSTRVCSRPCSARRPGSCARPTSLDRRWPSTGRGGIWPVPACPRWECPSRPHRAACTSGCPSPHGSRPATSRRDSSSRPRSS
jgi:LL-diaminopimelate aminotransferase